METRDLIALWYQALSAEYGIVIQTNNRERAKQRLYQARKEAADPALESLSILTAPNPDELFISKNVPLSMLPLEFSK